VLYVNAIKRYNLHMTERPTVLIWVEGGTVQGVYSQEPNLTYRLVDLDERDDPQGEVVRDLEADPLRDP
jgi:hypothetical protein